MAIKTSGNRPFSNDGKYEMSLEEFKKWLKRFDSDKDGRINKAEVLDAIRTGGVWFAGLRSRRGLNAADKNHNGYIDDNEINNLKDVALKYLGVRIVTY